MSADERDWEDGVIRDFDSALGRASSNLEAARTAFYTMCAANRQLKVENLIGSAEGVPGSDPPVSNPGITTLRRILQRFYDPKQGGGILGYRSDGSWGEGLHGLGVASSDELNALFALAGLVPRPVEVRGPCQTCRWARHGYERGHTLPCNTCTRPWHSNYEPADGALQDDFGLPDRIVRRVRGTATDLDRAVDSDRFGRLEPYAHLVAAAEQGGRNQVVEVIQEHLDRQDARHALYISADDDME